MSKEGGSCKNHVQVFMHSGEQMDTSDKMPGCIFMYEVSLVYCTPMSPQA